MAAKKIGGLSCIEIINKSVERMLFDSNLEPIEEHRNKLLYILLHHYVY
jgi:hypothetical protein